MEAEVEAFLGYEKSRKAIWKEMVIDFKQQTAVVTGGVGGIGIACVENLLESGLISLSMRSHTLF